MRWTQISETVKRRWSSMIAPLAQPRPRNSKAGMRPVYGEQDLFLAILKLVWLGRPLRERLGKKAPSPSPVHRALHFWAESGCLRKMWSAYLDALKPKELKAWLGRFTTPSSPATEVRRHSHWFIEMKKELERRCPR